MRKLANEKMRKWKSPLVAGFVVVGEGS